MNTPNSDETRKKREDVDSGNDGGNDIANAEEISEAEVFPDEEITTVSQALDAEETGPDETGPTPAELTHEEDSATIFDREENNEMKRLGSLLKSEEADDTRSLEELSLDITTPEDETPVRDTRAAVKEQPRVTERDEEPAGPGRNEGPRSAPGSTETTTEFGDTVFGSFVMKYKIPLAIFLVIIIVAAGWPCLRPASEDIEVFVPEKKIGDFAEYKVWGTIVSSSPGNETIKQVEFDILDTSTMAVTINGYTDILDGFGLTQNAYSIETIQDLDVEGFVETSLFEERAEVEGDIGIEETSYLVHKKAVRGHISSELDVSGKSGIGTLEATGDVDMFPSLTSDEEKAQLDDVYRETTIKKGDKGSFKKGEVTFTWSVVKQEKKFKYECLVVEYQLDKDELRETLSETFSVDLSDAGTVDDAYMRIWVADGVSLDVRQTVFITAHDENSELKFDYSIEMTRYSQGREEIRVENLGSPEKHELALREPWDTFPRHGDPSNSSIPTDFTLQTAYDEGNASNEDFRNYIENHPDDYLVYGKYNESNTMGIWNFTYSKVKLARQGFLMNVTRQSGTMISNDFGERLLSTIDPTLTVTKDRKELPSEMITFASAEQIFKSNDWVEDKAFEKSTGKINFDDYSLGVRTDLVSPGVDITSMNFDVEPSHYAYFIQREGGNDGDGSDDMLTGESFMAGVDAYTGQLLFIGEYEYEAAVL